MSDGLSGVGQNETTSKQGRGGQSPRGQRCGPASTKAKQGPGRPRATSKGKCEANDIEYVFLLLPEHTKKFPEVFLINTSYARRARCRALS